MSEVSSEISVSAIVKKGVIGKILWLFGPVGDRLLGIRRVREIYERDGLRGLDRFSFVERFVEKEKIRYAFDPVELSRIPPRGPVVVVANHPLGGLEGILLTWMLRLVRRDYKVMVNVMLLFLEELKEYFIYVNPMAKGSNSNFRAIVQARAWLAQGHCLLVFPAGRVGFYRPEKGYVTDEAWDLVALSLGIKTKATFVPVFIEGESSALFSILSRHVYPMKLLFLIWEFLRSFGKSIVFHVGRPIPHERLAAMGRKRANAWLRMRTYLLCPVDGGSPPVEGSLSSRALALVAAALDGDGRGAAGARGAGRGRARRGEVRERDALHPEVEDYIGRYGLGGSEIEELVEALDGERIPILDLKRRLDDRMGSTRDSGGRVEGKDPHVAGRDDHM